MSAEVARLDNPFRLVCGLLLAVSSSIGATARGDGPTNGHANDGQKAQRLEPKVAERRAGPERGIGVADLANPWLDKTVVLKSLRTELRVDGKVVATPGDRPFFHKFNVERISNDDKGNQLWVVDHEGLGLEGWVSESEIVLEDEARTYFTKVIERDPRPAEAHYQRGALDKARQSLVEILKSLGPGLPPLPPFDPTVGAIADLKEAMRLDPAIAAMSHVACSKIYAEQDDDSTRALTELNEAIRIDPNLHVAYSMRAAWYSEHEDAEHAIADLTEAIRINPGDFLAYRKRGDPYRENNDLDRALADLNRAARLARDDSMFSYFRFGRIASCYLSRGREYCRQDKFDLGIADFTQAISLAEPLMPMFDTYIQAVHNRAWAWYLKGDFDRAIAGFTEMIKLASSNEHKAVAYASRARARIRLEDVAGALADCEKACESEPNSPWGHDFRAWIRATCPDTKFRDGKKAVAEAKLGCELSSCKSPPCLETLAAAAAETGDFEAAIRYQWMAIDCLTDHDPLPQFLDRLELYRARQPYRDVPPKNDRR